MYGSTQQNQNAQIVDEPQTSPVESEIDEEDITNFIKSISFERRLSQDKIDYVIKFLRDASMKCPLLVLEQLNLLSAHFTSSFSGFFVLTTVLSYFKNEAGENETDNLLKLWCRSAASGLLSYRSTHASYFSKISQKLWKENPGVLISTVKYITSVEPTVHTLVLGSEVSDFLHSPLNTDAALCGTSLVENLLKALFQNKLLLSPRILTICAKVVSHCADENSFKSLIMPSVHRAILRSAEANMMSVFQLLNQVTFNLDFCAAELAQPIVKHLCALSDSVRRATIRVLCAIICRCSETESITAILKQVYSQVTGPEGRKAGQDTRLAGLTCLGELSAHGAKRISVVDKVGSTAVGLLLDYMDQESHEDTLIYASKQLAKWLCRFKSNLPDRFYNFIKSKAFDLKSSPSVRCAYLMSLDSGFTQVRIGDRLPAAIVPNLLASVQRAIGQPNHSPIVFESVCASLVWLKHFVAKASPITEDRVKSDLIPTPIWTLLMVGKRRPWFSERFLQTAPDYVLSKLSNLLELVLRELHAFIPEGALGSIHRTLVLLALHPFYTTVRQPALLCITSLVRNTASDVRWVHAKHLLHDLALCLSESGDDQKFSKPVDFATQKIPKPTESGSGQTDVVGLRVWNDVPATGPESEPPGLPRNRTRTRVVGSYVANLVVALIDVVSFEQAASENGAVKKSPRTWQTYAVPEYWRNVLDTYLSSLLVTSHPLVASPIPTLWERIRRRIQLPELCDDPDWIAFIGAEHLSRKWTESVDYFVGLPCLDPAHKFALQCLFTWSPRGFGGALIARVHAQLSDARFSSVSEQEVQIMLTPSTQLYNQELLESLPKYQKSTANVKRESKLYSYEVQLDILAAQKRREEMMKHSHDQEEVPLLEVLADQLTEKQLESVRSELEKEASVRKRMLQLDAEARHFTNLLTTVLSACLSPAIRSTPRSSHAVGCLALEVFPNLSELLVRLFANPLVAPYVLGAQVHCVSIALLANLSVDEVSPKPDEARVQFAPRIGWWSVRILSPARLLHRSDLALLQSDLNSASSILSNNNRILEDALMDAMLLTTCWSDQPIAVQTTQILNFFNAYFPQRDPNASLLFSILNPVFEFLLIASGWARPLLDELPSLPYPSLLVPDPDAEVDAVIPASVRARWKWVETEHVRNILLSWLHQLNQAQHSPGQEPPMLPEEFTSHVLPFASLFRLMRQIVEGCLYRRDALTDSGLLATESDDILESESELGATSEETDNLNRGVALLAIEVLRSTSHLCADKWSSRDGNSRIPLSLATSTVQSLIAGLVCDTSEAREISLQCILILVEKIPTLISQIADFKASQLADSTRATASTGSGDPIEPESVDANEKEEEQDGSSSIPATETDSKATPSDAVKTKKKPSKNQRRKYKQAQLIAGLTKSQGDVEQLTRPYESPAFWPNLAVWPNFQVRLWVARSDLSPEVSTLAERLWSQLGLHEACEVVGNPVASSNGMPAPVLLLDKPTMPDLLSPMRLAHRLLLESTRPCVPVQKSTADAFALCLLRRTPEELVVAMEQLVQLYRVMLYRDPPVTDSMGRILIPESPDRWRERIGLALSLARLPEAQNPSDSVYRTLRQGQLAAMGDRAGEIEETVAGVNEETGESLEKGTVPRKADQWLLNMFRFLVPDGLNDRHPAVQSQMLQAGLRAVNIYGKAHIDQLLPILETFLNKAPNVAELDAVRQSVLVLTGSLSRHLAADDPKVVNTFNRLLNTLNFPSDVVQQAVEDCLASLVKKLPEDQIVKTINRLMTTLLGSSGYAERHGAAHGIAGMARGLGIMSLKNYGIIDKLLPALDDSKSAKRREGALLAIERLSLGMGRLFEPYVIRLITGLLNSFGDASPGVREAASNTARAVMGKLSAHGVRLILPALLRAIDDQQSWRTKAESVELLSTMTHCAPKQLSACLPQIVPRLLEVLVDSQDRVKQAGMRALKQIGSVIRNPEVQALVPLLTSCLQDPLMDKMPCLRALRDTCFVHVLDAPSLALILPVIQRAFDDRSTEARKTAAQIFGNLHSLARQEELQPYVGTILPPLKSCLLDAVPEVRSVAAAAMGALVRGMGESCFTEILPWLITTLTSESSSVDRSGAAQGLAEVLGAMGIERLRAILPDLIRTAASDSKVQPHVRDGYLMLFIYLPAVFQDSFAEFIAPIIPTILKSLSDETEFLRETALRAAQQIIHMFAESSLELLLPELEQGMEDKNWRIRHASVQLLGDLLYQLSGLSGKGTTKTQDEDDTFGTSEAHERLKELMTTERHDRVLARLHMARSDPTLIVRQAAIHVWKVVVPNTSRTLREIMPVLIRLLLTTLGASNREQQQLAARALGDVVRKLGERILPEIIPLLVLGLESPDADQRRGVCTGLTEIMRNCPREQLVNYADGLLVPIRRTLCDRLPEVRRSGARTFELLYGALGVRSLDGVLPDLLAQLDDPDSNPYALDGLRQLLVVKGKAVMPYLVPKLTHPTVNVKAFAYLASVAGDALTRQLSRILPALLTTVSQLSDQPEAEEDLAHCAAVLICIYDASGVRFIFNTLLSGLAGTPPATASAPPGVIPGTVAYRLACLRLLRAYLEASYDPTDDGSESAAVQPPTASIEDQVKRSKQTKSSLGDETDDDNEEEDDDDDEDDYSSGDDDDDEEGDDESASFVSGSDENEDYEDEEVPDAKESVSRVLREFYPLALRNICRLLAVRDMPTLIQTWNCLESLFKRWSPESITTQVNDLRQGVRGAVSELHKAVASGRNKVEDEFLPGFSDPNLPLASLIKLYADCTLRGRVDIKEPAAQGLSECITHASGSALQRCVVKVIGPLIRLLGERQTNVVRMAVVESLTALVNKCPTSARPFVTQLQATFLKCLGDVHRPMRLLGGQGLASVVGITPKLDPLLIDLARVPVNTVLSNWPGDSIPGGLKANNPTPSVGAAATALTLAGVAAYPDTSLQALRLCLLGSAGRASMPALETVLTTLTPIMCLVATGTSPSSDAPYQTEDDDDVDYEDLDDSNMGLSDKPAGATAPVRLNPDAIRVIGSTCVGCVLFAAQATLTAKQPKSESDDSDLLQPARMLERLLVPTTTEKAHQHWAFSESQAISIVVALKHAPEALINKQAISAGITGRIEHLISQLSAHNQPVVSQLGYRCIGSFIGYVVENPAFKYDLASMMQLLFKGIRHEVIDIRLLITVIANHIAWRANLSNGTNSFPDWLTSFIALVLHGTRDKTSSVRQGSETAFAILCRFGAPASKEAPASASLLQCCINATDANSRASLDSLLQKLRKQSWTDVWRQGCPDMDNTALL